MQNLQIQDMEIRMGGRKSSWYNNVGKHSQVCRHEFHGGNTDARGVSTLYRRHPSRCAVQRDRCVTVPLLRRWNAAWLRPSCVLKVCHWVKVARAAERWGVADKWVTWSSALLRTFSSPDYPQSHTTDTKSSGPYLMPGGRSSALLHLLTTEFRLHSFRDCGTNRDTEFLAKKLPEIFFLFLQRRCLRTSKQPSLVSARTLV